MDPQPSKHILKAFAIHEGNYYPLTPRREVDTNALMYLGKAEGEGHATEEVKAWHASAWALLKDIIQNVHKVEPGNVLGGEPDTQLLLKPWYVIFEYGRSEENGDAVPGDLWVGRFFASPVGLAETDRDGVYAVDDLTNPVESQWEDDILTLSGQLVDRSVILAGRSAAGDNTLGSNQGGDEAGIRNEW